MKILIFHKLVLSSVFLVLLSAGVVGWIFYSNVTDILVDSALKEITYDVHTAGNLLQQVINKHNEDILFLAESPEIQSISKKVNTPTGDDMGGDQIEYVQRLERVFKDLLLRKGKYIKIRYINQNGIEIVAVYRDVSGVVYLRGKQLQNKSHRDYVTETLKLKKGEIHLSEINLNREFGKVEVPYQQVVRLATPVFDKKSTKNIGLVIITIEIGEVLKNILTRVSIVPGRTIYITNDKGDYLLHPDQKFIFGFDREKRYFIQNKIPQVMKYFSLEKTRKAINILPVNNASKNVIHLSKIFFDKMHPKRFVAVIMTQDYSSIVKKTLSVLDNMVLWALILVFFAILLAIILSMKITFPIKLMTTAVNDFKNNPLSKIVIPKVSNDEVGMLVDAFNAMILQVEKTQNKLTSLNGELESKVSQRTNDLYIAMEKAEFANAAKSEFLSRMSHELRTPLNAILGFAQILNMNTSSFTDIQKDNIQEILDAGYHLLELVNDVLNLSRIESGNTVVDIKDTEVDAVVQKSIALVQPLAASRHIEITDNLSGHDLVIRVDNINFKQILLNLLSNAIKYNRKNGKILLSYEIKHEQRLRIYIKDDGEGLTKANIEKLFTPFERLDATNEIDGVGIGLVITKYMVELMHGSIGVNSKPGEGSIFWIEFELAE